MPFHFSSPRQVRPASILLVAHVINKMGLFADATLQALTRLRRYLRSSGRYGASPFLVGHYGGLGEIAQGFCRVSAVNGGLYILDGNTEEITIPSLAAGNKFAIHLD